MSKGGACAEAWGLGWSPTSLGFEVVARPIWGLGWPLSSKAFGFSDCLLPPACIGGISHAATLGVSNSNVSN